jgi:hypothetical protein
MAYKAGKTLNYKGEKVVITAVNADGTATIHYASGSGKTGFAGTLPSTATLNKTPVDLEETEVTLPNGLALEEYFSEKDDKKFKYLDLYDNDTASEIAKAASSYKSIAEQLYAEYGLQTIREKGIGSNFSVVSPEDGFRKDNAVWFGKCEVCGGHVSSSRFDKGWTHSIATPILDKNGVPFSTGKSMVSIYACPEAL